MPDYQFLEGLNTQQLKAVQELDRHSTVLSCPGSGKTKIVETKVAYILSKLPRAYVCCTTFTKEGAQEIRNRVIKSLDPSISRQVQSKSSNRLLASTFHSIAYQALKKFWGKSPVIARPGEVKYFLTKTAFKLRVPVESDEFEDLKSFVESYPTQPPTKQAEATADELEFFNTYCDLMASAGKMDFNQMLVQSIQLLESGKMEPWPFTHIITDESQDNDYLMERWTHIHASNGSIITMLLDDDQSLYSFRNALGVNTCLTFEKAFSAQRITNATNYRSKSEIVDCASKLIAYNHHRVDKEFIANRGPGGSVNFHHIYDQSSLPLLLDQLIENPGEWFILCRTNADIKQLSAVLLASEIPFKSPDSKSLFESDQVGTYIELMRSLGKETGEGVEIALKFMNFDQDLIQEIHTANNTENLATCTPCDLVVPDSLLESDKKRLSDFFEKMDNWKRALQEKRDSRAIRLAGNYLAQYEKGDVSLIEMAMKILAKLSGSLLQRLNTVQQMLDKAKEDEDNPHVLQVMTAHASKGLQRKKVLIWNCREGSYPLEDPEGTDDIQAHYEEERRIFYVAMTRAEDELHLVYQSAKSTPNAITEYTVSRFIHELNFVLGEPIDFDSES